MPHHLSWWKIVLLLIGGCFALGVGWFVFRVGMYYRAIKAGEVVTAPTSRMSVAGRSLLPAADLSAEQRTQVETGGVLTMGPKNATVTVVEFLDYGCPFCEETFAPFRTVMGRYQDRVRFVVRDFPIDDLHPGATEAAIAARCAQAQGKGWSYHDKLFLEQERRTAEDLVQFAREAGLDVNAFGTCFEDPAIERAVAADLRLGISVGVRGTPTFFVNGIRVEGSLGERQLERMMDAALRATEANP